MKKIWSYFHFEEIQSLFLLKSFHILKSSLFYSKRIFFVKRSAEIPWGWRTSPSPCWLLKSSHHFGASHRPNSTEPLGTLYDLISKRFRPFMKVRSWRPGDQKFWKFDILVKSSMIFLRKWLIHRNSQKSFVGFSNFEHIETLQKW